MTGMSCKKTRAAREREAAESVALEARARSFLAVHRVTVERIGDVRWYYDVFSGDQLYEVDCPVELTLDDAEPLVLHVLGGVDWSDHFVTELILPGEYGPGRLALLAACEGDEKLAGKVIQLATLDMHRWLSEVLIGGMRDEGETSG